MIQIDDAGNGTVLGGEVIGALRLESGEYRQRILPLSAYFHFESMRTEVAKDAVLELLNDLNYAPGEPLVFCTGDIFAEAKHFLSNQGIEWQEQKITGALQELVEASYFNSLRQYGLPERFRDYHHQYHAFHNMVLGWVCRDLSARSRFCKPLRLNSGLVARAKFYRTVCQKLQTCSVCNTTIQPGSEAVVDKSGSAPVACHLSCFPAQVELSDFQEAVVSGEPARSFVNRFTPPPLCAACQKPVKHGKRMVMFRQQIFHFSCFSALIKSARQQPVLPESEQRV